MATAANLYHEDGSNRQAAPTGWRERTERFHLRPLPNEDVYFYAKKINNERLVRPVNYAARRKEVTVMAAGFGLLAMVVMLTLPHLLNTMAGVELQQLRAEHQELVAAHDGIDAKEAKVMDLERMKALARQKNMVPPSPSQIIHGEPKQVYAAVEAKLQP